MSLPSFAPVVEKIAPSVLALRDTRVPASATVWRDNLAVTVAHVMGRGTEGRVVLPDGREAKAVLRGLDRRADLAVVEIDAALAAPSWATTAPAVGDLVLSVARPVTDVRVTLGVVSAVGPAWRTPRGALFDRFLDVDGALGPGASGGPLVGGDGVVLGMNTQLVIRGGTTIPSSSVVRLAEAILRGEKSGPGFLGAAVQGARLDDAQRAAAGAEHALLVTGLTDGGPAMRAGVRVGDLLLSVDDTSLGDVGALLAALVGRADQSVRVRVLRGTTVEELAVTLAERTARHRHHGCG